MWWSIQSGFPVTIDTISHFFQFSHSPGHISRNSRSKSHSMQLSEQNYRTLTSLAERNIVRGTPFLFGTPYWRVSNCESWKILLQGSFKTQWSSTRTDGLHKSKGLPVIDDNICRGEWKGGLEFTDLVKHICLFKGFHWWGVCPSLSESVKVYQSLLSLSESVRISLSQSESVRVFLSQLSLSDSFYLHC